VALVGSSGRGRNAQSFAVVGKGDCGQGPNCSPLATPTMHETTSPAMIIIIIIGIIIIVEVLLVVDLVC
jgi:hypothetical protein